jgi:hypothetical protein
LPFQIANQKPATRANKGIDFPVLTKSRRVMAMDSGTATLGDAYAVWHCKKYGYWTSVMSALTTWAIIAGLE